MTVSSDSCLVGCPQNGFHDNAILVKNGVWGDLNVNHFRRQERLLTRSILDENSHRVFLHHLPFALGSDKEWAIHRPCAADGCRGAPLLDESNGIYGLWMSARHPLERWRVFGVAAVPHRNMKSGGKAPHSKITSLV